MLFKRLNAGEQYWVEITQIGCGGHSEMYWAQFEQASAIFRRLLQE